ncbi:hypothetical protein SteCoe_30824 [Stentor coeruleus]|uniref:Uncharacterized protein n=1 Tax=Stentor coeruleus TaxID=5963 RepID=A0A1R2B2U7_9CILI|nr:hypothetical protein SteCoe_30824 [Stentor coeruleus]
MDSALSIRTDSPTRNIRSSCMQRNEAKSISYERPASVKFLYMNIRNKSYVIAPSKKKFSHISSTSESVGPGKYNINSHSRGPSHEFSKVPRFEKSAAYDYLARVPSFGRIKLTEKIEYNKDLSRLTTKQQVQKRQKSSELKKIKAEIIKIAHTNILKHKKEVHENKIKEKYKRIEYNQKLGEIKEIKKTWVTLKSALGMIFILKVFIKNKKNLRIRIFSMLKKFQQIARCIGKMRLILKNFRKNRAIKTLMLLFVPYMKSWLKTRKKKYMNLVALNIEKVLSCSMLFNTIAKWHKTILTMQRFIKKYLTLKKILYDKLLNMWNESEAVIFKKKLTKTKKRTIKSKTRVKKTLGVSTIPEEIKKHYITKLIWTKLKDYLEQIKKYTEECREIDYANKEQEFEILIMNQEKVPYPQKPVKPRILPLITRDNFSEMIQTAERERNHWGVVIHAINTKLQMSYIIKTQQEIE